MKNSIYLGLLLIWSCGSQASKTMEPNRFYSQFEKVVLVDTFHNELQLDTASFITEAEFHPMYIGKIRDSIALKYRSRAIKNRTLHWKENRRPNSADLEIFVDTTRKIGSATNIFIPPPPGPQASKVDWNLLDHRGKISSYPVMLANHSGETLNIGFGEYLPLLIEARDSLGNWRPIQEAYRYHCGTGLTSFYLPPEEILITSCKQYSGDYRTTMRLVLESENPAYSNEFYGAINYQQFDEPKYRYY